VEAVKQLNILVEQRERLFAPLNYERSLCAPGCLSEAFLKLEAQMVSLSKSIERQLVLARHAVADRMREDLARRAENWCGGVAQWDDARALLNHWAQWERENPR